MWNASGLIVLLITFTSAENCSTWFHPAENGQCSCGSPLGTVVVCNNETQEVGILNTYCITSKGDGSNTSVVGRCLVVWKHGVKPLTPAGTYDKVLPSIVQQEEQTCGYFNRQGQLCGQCKTNHSVSAYSYDIKCHPCTSNLWSAILQYICIAYLPLTVFLCVVLVFRISVTSPAMNVPVLYCQLLSLPFVLRVLLEYKEKLELLYYERTLATLYGIWNLDFFRTIIPPICLPLNTMQLIALDYLVAVYPLLLLACFYMLVTAHDKGCRLLVSLWRPFFWCTARLRQQWNIRHSIINAFATFLLLSHIKFLNTSMDLLTPTQIRDEYGAWVGYFLYTDATIRFMGHQHKLYAILAILVILVVIMFPLLFLLLYPMMWFQKCLNRCGLNRPGLRVLMQCFQGCYRDKTDGGLECRYFSAVYPAFRAFIYVIYSITLSSVFYPAVQFLCICIVATLLLVQPYNKSYQQYNRVDGFLLLCLVAFLLGIVQAINVFHVNQIPKSCGYIVIFIFSPAPLIYFTVKYSLLLKTAIIQKLSTWRVSTYALTEHAQYEQLSEYEECLIKQY